MKNNSLNEKVLKSSSNNDSLLLKEEVRLFYIKDDGITIPRIELFYGRVRIPLRYISLSLLALKAVCVVLCTRLSFKFPSKDGLTYIPSVAVVCSEFIKLTISLIMIFVSTAKKDIKAFPKALNIELTSDKWGNTIVLIPGILFLFQNNLLYISLKRLPAALYQVMYQLKILTTTFFSVLILKRKLSITRWFACFTLILGVVLIPKKSKHNTIEPISGLSEFIIGLLAAFTSSFTSGLGAVILEKILKTTDERIKNGDVEIQTSVWGRNLILALIGICGGIPISYFSSRDQFAVNGVFQGFSPLVILVVLLNACTGFVVVAVLKYADGIMKCFCNAFSIVLITLISWLFLGDTKMSSQFAIAATIVIYAITIYSLDKAVPSNFTSVFNKLFSRFDKEEDVFDSMEKNDLLDQEREKRPLITEVTRN